MTIKTPQTIYDVLYNTASSVPNYDAYDFMGKSGTYADMLLEIDSCADTLAEMGIVTDDIISIYLPNMPFALVLFYAINKIGAISNFIHPLLPVNDHIELLHEMNPKAVFMLDSFYEKLNELKSGGLKTKFVLVKTSDYLPVHLKFLYMFKEINYRKQINFDFDTNYYKQILGNAKRAPQSLNKTALILFTGGTTGRSKGVCLSNRNVNLCAAQTKTYQKTSKTQDKMLAILPVFHGFGLVVCIHTTIMATGKVFLLPYYTDKLFKKTIMRKKPNYIIGVPRLYARLTHILSKTNLNLHFFKGLYCGGAALSNSVQEEAAKILKCHNSPVIIREGYGLTECVSACTLMPEDEFRQGSVGKPYPGVEIEIRDLSSDQPMKNGKIGEICIKSETIMNGYFNTDSPNIKLTNDEKWLYSGDIGYLDDDGFLYFTDRLKRMIKIAGYEVFPTAVEEIIGSVSGIVNSCVVESSKKGLTYLKAFLVCSLGSDKSALIELIKSACAEKLPGYSIPGEFEYLDSIPETLMKKNDYRKLS